MRDYEGDNAAIIGCRGNPQYEREFLLSGPVWGPFSRQTGYFPRCWGL